MSIYNDKNEKNGIVVFLRHDEDIESLIKRFKRKVMKSGILREVKKASYFEKPNKARKRKQTESRIRRAKDERKQKMKRSNFKNESNSSDK